jgi:PAS domain S-box-containing protein
MRPRSPKSPPNRSQLNSGLDPADNQVVNERDEPRVDSTHIARAVGALSDGVVLTDPALPDHPIVWANDAFLELTGYRRDEVVGRNCRFLQGPLTDRGTIDRVRHAIGAREHFHEALLNYRKDGTAFWNALTVSPVLDSDGRLVNFVAAQTDISAVKRLEGQLRHAEKIELVGRMAGGIAHDFNNVLTALYGYLQLLEFELTDEAPQAYVAEMMRAADRAKGLSDRLMTFSRKRDVVAAATLDLNEAVDGLRGLLEPLLRGRAVLDVQLASSELPVVTDLGELEQVIVNLVVNACDASQDHGEVRISTSMGHEGYACVVVEDDGTGMDEATRERIFEPFFTTKGEGRGTGLGLANVSEIVQRAGGKIDVESTLGAGTRFTVHLPLEAVSSQAAA